MQMAADGTAGSLDWGPAALHWTSAGWACRSLSTTTLNISMPCTLFDQWSFGGLAPVVASGIGGG
jgi:hypothetical protein